MSELRNECPIHGLPRYAHILACAHRGAGEVWLADQGNGTCIVYEIADISERERAYDALDWWVVTGAGEFKELERLHAAKCAVERMSPAVSRTDAQGIFDAAVMRLMAGDLTVDW